MTVNVAHWNNRGAVAFVDHVRVILRANADRTRVRWICHEHGESVNTPNLCGHTAALAAEPADPAKYH